MHSTNSKNKLSMNKASVEVHLISVFICYHKNHFRAQKKTKRKQAQYRSHQKFKNLTTRQDIKPSSNCNTPADVVEGEFVHFYRTVLSSICHVVPGLMLLVFDVCMAGMWYHWLEVLLWKADSVSKSTELFLLPDLCGSYEHLLWCIIVVSWNQLNCASVI